MKITRYFFRFALLVAALSISLAFWEKGFWIGTVLSITWLILWWIGEKSEISVLPSIFFVVFIGFALVGFFLGLRPTLLFLGVLAALNTWDTGRFHHRWNEVGIIPNLRKIELNHLLRLLAVDGSTIILAVIGLSFQAQLKFGIILIVGFLAIISLSRLISLLRSQS